MPTPERLDEYQAAQVGLRALASDALTAFWATLDVENAPATRDALLEFLPLVTDEYGLAAAALAADWYDDLRETEAAARTAFAATMQAPVPHVQVHEQVRYAAGHLFGGVASQTLVYLLNQLGKDVLQPGWDTIVKSANADPDAYGWHRETRATDSYENGCGFCQMLAGRGGVYKKSTADFASHGKCACVAYPSFDPDVEEVPVLAYMASRRTSTAADRARVRAFIGDGPERNRF